MGHSFNLPLSVPMGVERLRLGHVFNHALILPHGLKELEFSDFGLFNHPLALPISLLRLVLSARFRHPITLPCNLEYVQVCGNFNQQFLLPPALKVLDLKKAMDFNQPLQLPQHLEELYLSSSFNQPITLPDSLHTAMFGFGFKASVTFGNGLRKLMWHCDHPISLLPNTLEEITFGSAFLQPVELPHRLKRVYFLGEYSLGLILPTGCVRHDPDNDEYEYSDTENTPE